MQKLFGQESLFTKVMTVMANLMLINVLWLICCLPIITIGAATSAMYTVVMRMIREKETGIIKPFFQAFARDFKKATGLFFIMAVLAVIVAMDILIVQNLYTAFLVVAIIPAAFFLLVASNVFPLFSQFENTLAVTLKNAVFFSIGNLWRSILMAVLDGIPLWLLLISWQVFLQSSLIWLLIGFALTAYLKLLLIGPVFDRYIASVQNQEEGTV